MDIGDLPRSCRSCASSYREDRRFRVQWNMRVLRQPEAKTAETHDVWGALTMHISIKILREEDEEELLAFESRNRSYFETMVPGRGKRYDTPGGFRARHRELLKEQDHDLSRFYLVRDDAYRIVGRINLVNIEANRSATLVSGLAKTMQDRVWQATPRNACCRESQAQELPRYTPGQRQRTWLRRESWREMGSTRLPEMMTKHLR